MLKISKDLFDLLYPIGTYYETSNSNWSPSSAGWYGTWVEDSSGKTTVAKDTGTFKTLGASVGSESKTTGNHTLKVDEIPRHTHDIYDGSHGSGSSYDVGFAGYYTSSGGQSIYRPQNNGVTDQTGGILRNTYIGEDQPHNHGNINVIQPSIVVRRWHRTA